MAEYVVSSDNIDGKEQSRIDALCSALEKKGHTTVKNGVASAVLANLPVGNNKIQVNSDEDPDPFTRNVDSVIDYTPSIKKDGSVVGLDGKTLTWTIIANEAAKVSMAGGTITDTIRESSRQYMTYSGDGITVKVYKADGTYVETRNIAWNELEEKTDSTWTYRVPESDSDKAYKYVITYTTEVDTTGATTIVTVENDVHTEHGVEHARLVYGLTTSQTGATILPYDGVISNIFSTDSVLVSEANAARYPSFFRSMTMDITTANASSNNQKILDLLPSVTKVRIYMWIEGQDVDCEDYASYGDITFDLKFTTNPA